ncbi:MAG: LemA family protein [Candidatus Magasanikbacteria bacterium]
MDILLYIAIAIVVIILLWFIFLYNSLVKKQNRVEEAWSDIDVQLQRRHNLIPNLVDSVKGYMEHEQDTLENVTKYREQAEQARNEGNTKQLAQIEDKLSSSLGSLQVAVEDYPELKASQNVSELMDELSDTENKIQAARRFYNGQVRDFNTKIESFPANLVAGALGFSQQEFYEIEEEGVRENPDVDLGSDSEDNNDSNEDSSSNKKETTEEQSSQEKNSDQSSTADSQEN